MDRVCDLERWRVRSAARREVQLAISEMWDVRLFCESGEWHCWKTGDGIWRARFAQAAEWKDEEVRDYVLWGREAHPNSSWTSIREANGTCIDVPFPVGGDLKQTPVRLRVWLAIGYDKATGQAYIADLMLRHLHQ